MKTRRVFMSRESSTIISDRSAASGRRTVTLVVFAGAIVAGTLAAIAYAHAELTLSHYDARAHLVVSRRVVDSLTPGWRQIGGVWLPLPHLVNLLPVQLDFAYRTGVTAVALSVAILSWGLAALAGYVQRATGSVAAALLAPALVLANPNVLYLQSTPMTEPLLFGFSLLALASVDRFVRHPGHDTAWRAGGFLAALVLTRYEGWLVASALLLLTVLILRRRALRAPLWSLPIAAIALFLVMSRASTGAWLQTSGFFVAQNPAFHDPAVVLDQIWSATGDLAGPWLLYAGLAGVIACAVRARSDPASLLPLALVATAALPALAFYEGHPLRVRYMVPLVVACGVLAGVAAGAIRAPVAWLGGRPAGPRAVRAVVAMALFAAAIATRPPLWSGAPMVREAQWETPLRLARRDVTGTLRRVYDHTPILASMGSLGHYMQEASAAGLQIRNFVHEGNGDLWAEALAHPKRHVRWILIEEQAEGGDVLAARAREDPAFLEGFERLTESGGLVLYRRND